MFNPGKALGRAMVGSLFVYGGQNAIKNRAHLVPMIDAAQERYGLKGQHRTERRAQRR